MSFSVLCYFGHSLLFLQFILSIIPCYPFNLCTLFVIPAFLIAHVLFFVPYLFIIPAAFNQIFRHSLSSCPSFIPSILLRHSRNSYIILGILTSFLQFLHHSWNSYIIPATFTSFPQLSSSFPQLSSSFPRRRESSTLVYFIAFYHFLIKKCAK